MDILVRTAADTDLCVTVIGILGSLQFHAPPLATVPAPALHPSRQQFRLNTGVFIEESYTRFLRQVRDFQLTLTLFRAVSLLATVLASAVVAALLHDIHKDRLCQYAVLAAVGFSPFHLLALILGTALTIAIAGIASGFLLAAVFFA